MRAEFVAVASIVDVPGIEWLLQSVWVGCAVLAAVIGASMLRKSRSRGGTRRR